MSKSRLFVAVASLATLVSFGSPAIAGEWARHHPRQHEVLAREHHQIHRINRERREGELTRGQAHALRQGDRAIAHQERADARAHGGSITRAEQRQLNNQENAQSHAIGH